MEKWRKYWRRPFRDDGNGACSVGANCLVFLILSLMFFACKDDNNNETATSSIVVSNPASLTQERFAEHREATSVVFTTSGAWSSTVSENSEWISFDPKQGNDARQYTVSIVFMQNTTGVDRTAVFTIVSGTDEVPVTITQKGVCSSGTCNLTPDCIETLNSIAFTQVVQSYQTTATSVTFLAGETWTSTITGNDDAWVVFAPQQGNAGENTVAITLMPNNTDNDRTAVFTIKCSGGDEKEITVTQLAEEDDVVFDNIVSFVNAMMAIEGIEAASAQALAEDREPLAVKPVHRVLVVGCEDVTYEGVNYKMNEEYRQLVRNQAKFFEDLVEYFSNYNVIMEADVLFIERNVVLPDGNGSYVTQASIQADLDVHAPFGTYDGIIVTGAVTDGRVHLGVMTARYGITSGDYGYCWYLGSSPPFPTEVHHPSEERSFPMATVMLHEWQHMLEFMGAHLDVVFPPVHSYQGPSTSDSHIGYQQYPTVPPWDFGEFYRDWMFGNVPYRAEGIGPVQRVGMFPHMWRFTPRFYIQNFMERNVQRAYIRNAANNQYLSYSGNNTTLSATPRIWTISYVGSGRIIIVADDLRVLDINNAANNECQPVVMFRENPGFPHAQTWRVSQNSDFTIKLTTTFASDNRVLSRRTASCSTHASAISINTSNDSQDQKWYIELINE